uniref:Uncharacterized mitochondrial protein AtMg00810-like n=1 Tax=Tanacetum cinerariifolium TaxID=118510 RepID=A0A6L2JYP2_TANCI|nr:uncharacterized mitochondrial protein AtMg00810-like [Tanacetum cinerariifolium]
MTRATSSSRLVPNSVSQQACIPPNRDDLDHLFQPMFDEYFNPPLIVVTPVQEADASIVVVLADSFVLTSIDQNAPSTSITSTQEQKHSPDISQGFEKSPKTPTFHDAPLYESLHKDSTSQGLSSNVRQTHTAYDHLGRWTKDHPIKNMMTKFNTSMMGQMSFFLGLQISQSPRGIFINQSKYASKIVKKYDLLSTDSVDTPMVEKNKLDEDLQGTPVDVILYRGKAYQKELTRGEKDLLDTLREPSTWASDSSVLRQQECNCLCCNNVQLSRAKHIVVRYHFIKEQVENGIV